MAIDNNTERKSTGTRSRNSNNSDKSINREPASQTGTIRNNLERYRTDNVSDVKARQAGRTGSGKTRPSSQARKANQEALKRKRRKKLIIRLAVTLFVILICVFCFLFTYRIFYDVPYNEEDTSKVEIEIPSAEITDEEVAQILYDAGCISDVGLYKLRTYIYDANYVPGTYKVSPSFTTEKIINILSGYDYSDGTMEE